MSLFGPWIEKGWWWDGWWMKWPGQHQCHWYLWWSAHHLVWLEAIHLSLVKSMCGNKMAQLLTAPKPSCTYSKVKESFCDCWRSFGLCIPQIATSTFSCEDGSNSKFEESSPPPLMTSRQPWKISMLQYWTNTSAQQQQPLRSGARRFCLQMV